MSFVIVIICSLFSIYEYAGALGYTKYLALPTDNTLLVIIQSVSLKWSLAIGVIGVFYSIVGLLFMRDDNVASLKWGVPVFYILFTVLLVV